MGRYVLDMLREIDPSDMTALIRGAGTTDRHLLALLYEACILNTRFEPLKVHFQELDPGDLAACSPMIIIPSTLRDHSDQHFYWLRQFSANANLLRPLPSPDQAEFPVPFDREAIPAC